MIKKITIIFILAFFLNLSFTHAVPLIPDTFYGTVKLDNNNVTIGSIITITVAEIIDSTYTMTKNGQYELFVKKGNFGDEINFYINNNLFGTRTRAGGIKENYNLSYTTPPKDPEEKPITSSGGSGSYTPPIINTTNETITPTYNYDFIILAPNEILVTQGGTKITTITIKNTGNITLKNLQIEINGNFPDTWNVITPNTITELKPNEEQNIQLTINTPELSSNIYNFKLTVKNTNKEKTKNMILEVTKANLMNANNIQILSIIPETALIPGKTTRFFITLKNTGKTAEYGLLQLNNFGNWNMTPEYKYIGLDPNVQTTIIFKITVPENAILEYKEITATLIGQTLAKNEITVEITNNQETLKTKNTPTGFLTKNTTNAIAGLIIILLIAGAIYFFKRKKE